jgi:hypothetical protein
MIVSNKSKATIRDFEGGFLISTKAQKVYTPNDFLTASTLVLAAASAVS